MNDVLWYHLDEALRNQDSREAEAKRRLENAKAFIAEKLAEMMQVADQYATEIQRRHIVVELEQTGVALTLTLKFDSGESIILLAAASESDAVFHIEVFGAGSNSNFKMGPRNWNLAAFRNVLNEAVSQYVHLGSEKGFLREASSSA